MFLHDAGSTSWTSHPTALYGHSQSCLTTIWVIGGGQPRLDSPAPARILANVGANAFFHSVIHSSTEFLVSETGQQVAAGYLTVEDAKLKSDLIWCRLSNWSLRITSNCNRFVLNKCLSEYWDPLLELVQWSDMGNQLCCSDISEANKTHQSLNGYNNGATEILVTTSHWDLWLIRRTAFFKDHKW